MPTVAPDDTQTEPRWPARRRMLELERRIKSHERTLVFNALVITVLTGWLWWHVHLHTSIEGCRERTVGDSRRTDVGAARSGAGVRGLGAEPALQQAR